MSSTGRATVTCVAGLAETIIYEIHVRGFTQSHCSEVQQPGTYSAIIEKIPYLKSLGITAIELMPVHEFPIVDCFGQKPPRPNYWGYDPICFFAPHRGYAVGESRAVRCGNSRRWSARCTGRASR